MKSSTSSPGRPRDASIDTAVLEATRALLTEYGYGDLSLAAIAARAGTTRQALYRRWPNKALIVLDAMFSTTVPSEIPDLGSLREELRLGTRRLAAEFNDPVARSTVSGLLSDLGTDDQLHSRVRDVLLEPEHAKVRAIFERAAERGDTDAGIATGVLVEMIGGAIVYRTCFLGLPADDDFVDSVVETAVAAARKGDQ